MTAVVEADITTLAVNVIVNAAITGLGGGSAYPSVAEAIGRRTPDAAVLATDADVTGALLKTAGVGTVAV